VTETEGISIFGRASMPKMGKHTNPIIVRTKNRTIVGTGVLIDQAEMLLDIGKGKLLIKLIMFTMVDECPP
jgi:hypothetical protein